MISAVNLTLILVSNFLFYYAYRVGDKAVSPKKSQSSSISSFKYVQPVIAVLVAICAYGQFIINAKFLPTLIEPSWSLTLISSIMTYSGIIIIALSKKRLGENFSHCADPKIPNSLIMEGPYSLVRHPIYTGNLFFLGGIAFFSQLNIIILVSIFVVYLYYRKSIHLEENDLKQTFDRYEEYSRDVNPLFPNISSIILALQSGECSDKIEIKRITDDTAIKEFSSNFSKHSNVNLPFYYFRKCLVRGLYLNENLIGGYSIAFDEAIGWPKKVKYLPPFFDNITKRNISEINGAWIMPEYAQKSAFSGIMWTKCILDATSNNMRLVTFMAPTYKTGLINLYSKISNGYFYHDNLITEPYPEVKIFWTYAAKLRVLAFYEIFKRAIKRWSIIVMKPIPNLLSSKLKSSDG